MRSLCLHRHRLALIASLIWLTAASVGHAQVSIDLGVDVGDSTGGGVSSGVGDAFQPPNAGLGLEDIQPLAADRPLGQEEALEAVRARRALPLAPIVKRMQEADLLVVDATLVSVRGILVYELRVVDNSGTVSQAYFYARTGKQIETN